TVCAACPTATQPPATVTLGPTATATGFYCSFYALGASSSCNGSGVYSYAFDLHNTCSTFYGSVELYFDVAPDGTGPWTTLDERMLYQQVGTSIQGSFTETNIPPQYHWYRVHMVVSMLNWSADNVTPEEYLCNLPPTPTPCASCPTATPTTCTVGWS